MNVPYTLSWRASSSLEELTEEEWNADICFRFLREVDKNSLFLEVQFKNRLDNWEHLHKNANTGDWLAEFDLSGTNAEKGIVETRVEEDFYYVTLDLSVLSYGWIMSILTLYRYPGEYYNICWNYWEIRKKYPTCTTWKALYLAHQGTWMQEYRSVFDEAWYYNIGHSLFKNGQWLKNLNIEQTFFDLDNLGLFFNRELSIVIQDLWCGYGYMSFLDFNVSLPEGWNYEFSSS